VGFKSLEKSIQDLLTVTNAYQHLTSKASQGFPRLLKASQGFSRLLKASQGFSRLLKASQGFSRLNNFY
jgi:hypothetical protein